AEAARVCCTSVIGRELHWGLQPSAPLLVLVRMFTPLPRHASPQLVEEIQEDHNAVDRFLPWLRSSARIQKNRETLTVGRQIVRVIKVRNHQPPLGPYSRLSRREGISPRYVAGHHDALIWTQKEKLAPVARPNGEAAAAG